jgi:SurA-like protein/parvulin-like peptidyl-prolyl cis-trans isomerase-like protein
MITILRKHHRWLMIVIAILAVPFVFYFNKTDLGAQRSTDLGRIYNRPVTQVEFTRNARLLNLASSLGLSLGNDLMTANVASENEMYVEFTWNRLILRHEAEQLGIRPNSSEITAFVKTLPRFRGQAGFDIDKYNEFTKGMLPSLGFNEAQIEELVSDQLSLNRVKDLLGIGTQVSESESMENYEKAYGKMDAAVVRLREEDFQKDVKITDEEITKYYEAHKAELKSEEKRRIEFVTFMLTEAEKKLTGKERVDPLQKVADRANDFTQALLEKSANFGEIASKFQSPVAATGEFTAAAPDPQLAANPQLTQYSFQLTEQAPFSDPIQGPDGFYVLHLLGITEAHPFSLEEAKPKIVETLKSERLRELVSNKGADVARQIREALKSGTPLEKAVQQSGLKLERIPPFSLVETPAPKPEMDKEKPKDEKPKVETPKDKKPKDKKSKDEKSKNEKLKDETPKNEKPKDETPELPAIKNAVAVLNPGEVSEFVPAGKGGLVAVLEKRAPADPSGYAAAKAQFESRYLLQRRGAIFVEWLRDRRRAAGVSIASG